MAWYGEIVKIAKAGYRDPLPPAVEKESRQAAEPVAESESVRGKVEPASCDMIPPRGMEPNQLYQGVQPNPVPQGVGPNQIHQSQRIEQSHLHQGMEQSQLRQGMELTQLHHGVESPHELKLGHQQKIMLEYTQHSFGNPRMPSSHMIVPLPSHPLLASNIPMPSHPLLSSTASQGGQLIINY